MPFSGDSFFEISSASVQPTLTRRSIPGGGGDLGGGGGGGGAIGGRCRLVRELIGRSCCCRGNKRGSERVCHLQLSPLKLEGAQVPGMA